MRVQINTAAGLVFAHRATYRLTPEFAEAGMNFTNVGKAL